VLKEHCVGHAEERLTAGPQWTGSRHYVFTTGWGGPVYPDTVSSLMADLIKAHNAARALSFRPVLASWLPPS
jgi:integrase